MTKSQAWWRTPVIPALRRQRQVDLCEFEASQIYIKIPSDTGLHSEALSNFLKKKSEKEEKPRLESIRVK